MAPMRSLALHHAHVRSTRSDTEPVAPAVLFFGCRKSDKDCLFAADWTRLVDDGTLQSVLFAFSRDQVSQRQRLRLPHVHLHVPVHVDHHVPVHIDHHVHLIVHLDSLPLSHPLALLFPALPLTVALL